MKLFVLDVANRDIGHEIVIKASIESKKTNPNLVEQLKNQIELNIQMTL